jgi:phage FluMu protein Com
MRAKLDLDDTRRVVPGDVRCRCGALLFRARGVSDVDIKCRRCRCRTRFICKPTNNSRPEPHEGRSPANKEDSDANLQNLPQAGNLS